MGNEGSGFIQSAHRSRIIGMINVSLDALHTRFKIFTRDMILRTDGIRTLYALREEHADTNESTEPKWIEDNIQNPFREDIIKILKVFDEDENELSINNIEDDKSIYFPSFELVQVPEKIENQRYFIMYQAKHGLLNPSDPMQLVYLPTSLFSALEAYVSYMIFSSMNGQEHLARSQEHLMRYERICQMVENEDILHESAGAKNNKLDERGFA